MALLGRDFIAAPDTSKGQIVFKWPDHNIRKFTRCIVEPDAVAVFMSQGQVMGTLLGGQHQLDAHQHTDGVALEGHAERAADEQKRPEDEEVRQTDLAHASPTPGRRLARAR